jgi:hypothetical protein
MWGEAHSAVRFPTPGQYFTFANKGFGTYTAGLTQVVLSAVPGCPTSSTAFPFSFGIERPALTSISPDIVAPNQSYAISATGAGLALPSQTGMISSAATGVTVKKNGVPVPGFTAMLQACYPYCSSTAVNVALNVGPDVAAGVYDLVITALGVEISRPLTVGKQLAVSVDGTPLAGGGYAYIAPDPHMPNVTARVLGGAPSDTVKWRLTIDYTGPDSPPTEYAEAFPAEGLRELPGNATWVLADEWRGLFRGGNATLYWTYGTEPERSLSFFIRANNPDVATARAHVRSYDLWFLIGIAKHEASGVPNTRLEGYNQFFTGGAQFGLPVWTNNHGFGMMQVETQTNPRPEPDVLWSWVANISFAFWGRLMNFLDLSNGDPRIIWERQLFDYNRYNSDNPNNPAPPPDDSIEGPCIFSISNPSTQEISQNNPRSYWEAIWIKMYNGGTYYIGFDPNGHWNYNRTNHQGVNYVNRVCTNIE